MSKEKEETASERRQQLKEEQMTPKEKKVEASITKMLAWAVKLFPLAMSSVHGHAARRKRASDLWAVHRAIEGEKPMANFKEKLRRARGDKRDRQKEKKLGITKKKKELPKRDWSRDEGDGMATIDNDKNKSWRDEEQPKGRRGSMDKERARLAFDEIQNISDINQFEWLRKCISHQINMIKRR